MKAEFYRLKKRRSPLDSVIQFYSLRKNDSCCQVCLARQGLVVHHRRPGTEGPAYQIALCRRCHVRLHRRRQLPGEYSDLFFRLWREQHPGRPAQLRLPLAAP